MYWGLSEALDLYQEYLNAFMKSKSAENATDEEKSTLKNDEQYSDVVWDFGEGNKEKTHRDEQINDHEKPNTSTSVTNKVDPTPTEHQQNMFEIEKKVGEMSLNEKPDTSKGAIKKVRPEIEKNVEEMSTSSNKEQEIPDTSKGAIKKIKSHPLKVENNDKFIKPEELNILLFGSGDPRHILQTIAKLYKHRSENGDLPEINFYIIDGCIEITARNLLLLAVALENPKFFSITGKTHLFMDIYGNSLMRPTSHHYMISKAKALLKIVSDPIHLTELAPMLDLDHLKYIERDGLESAFNFWLPKPGHVFDIATYWDSRNRQLLGERYDAKDGAFDWDLSMKLKDRQGKQICNQEYRHWRDTGIAFTYPEFEQCKPNKTLAAGLMRNGERYRHRGFVGDIQTGPFCAYGLKTEDTAMLNSNYGQNDYRATDITERNLLEIMHELQTETPYVHNKEWSRKFGVTRLQMGKCLEGAGEGDEPVESFMDPWINKENVNLYFLSADEIHKMQQSQNSWKGFFDIVFIAQNYFPFIKENFGKVFKPQCLLIMETKCMSTLRNDKLTEFETELMNFAKLHQFEPVINYSALNTKTMLLKYKRKAFNTV